MSENVYYSRLEAVIKSVVDAIDDGQVTLAEVWSIVAALIDAAKDIMQEAVPFTEKDCDELTEAAQLVFDKYIKPIDLPGADRLIDPIIRRFVIPNMIHGLHQMIQRRLG